MPVPFTLPDGLAPEIYPLAWLVGRWSGEGVVEHPEVPRTRMISEVLVSHDGGPYLTWESTLRLVPEPSDGAGGDDDGVADPVGQVWSRESGFWRVPADRPQDVPADKHPVELLLTDPAGHLALYAGVVGNGRIDLVSDLIARTPDAVEVSAATRLYGLVDGDLLWTWDLAAFGLPLQSYASAQLERVG
ncbi:FABP family protein [Actinotalea sp. K2]|uniref:FABP family protein n=1 Tax=Actinotalea sp. K2 TaxID=2939438 RepID=UPI002017CF40|nr:FABP family protein [Actinotalea sp. K2]MCL3859538.1 FABP family protein [Actinotalea sp. K2]